MKLLDKIIAIDDSGLDPFSRSVLIHILRRGFCYESKRKIAAATSMSAAKCCKVIDDLLTAKWLKIERQGGKSGYVVTVHHMNTFVHDMNKSVHHVNSGVHDMNSSVHHVNKSVHHVNTILSHKEVRPKSDHEVIETPTPSEELAASWELTTRLVDSWCDISRTSQPYLNGSPQRNQRTYNDYHFPATDLLKACEWDIEQATELLTAKRQEMILANITPKRLSAIVPQILADQERAALIAAESQQETQEHWASAYDASALIN